MMALIFMTLGKLLKLEFHSLHLLNRKVLFALYLFKGFVILSEVSDP